MKKDATSVALVNDTNQKALRAYRKDEVGDTHAHRHVPVGSVRDDEPKASE